MGQQALLIPQCPVLTTPCPHSCGQVAGGHPQCWERIWAKACRALQQSMESELRLAVQEQTMVRPHMGWAQLGALSPVLSAPGALLILFQYHSLGDDVSQCWQATGMGYSAPAHVPSRSAESPCTGSSRMSTSSKSRSCTSLGKPST